METTTAVRGMGRAIRPPARCKRGTAQPAEKRTARVSGNGFLSHQFKPFWGFNGDRDRAEREFKHSLSNLCQYYGLPIPECVNGIFPQNIYQTWQVIAEKLKAKDKQLECIIASDESHVATLTTVNRYDTGMCLYYIPVRPLWHWVQSSQAQKMAELLLSIFAYLHQVVSIPFYTEPHSYLAGEYEMMAEWVNEDDSEDNTYRQQQLDELYTMRNAGLKLHEQLRKPDYVGRFESIVINFDAVDEWEIEWHSIALGFLELYRQYTERSIFDNIHAYLLYPADEQRVGADQYISFYWSGDDCIAESLFSSIECSLQEMAYTDEPMQVVQFDHLPEPTAQGFDFETRLFDLIHRLCKRISNHDDEICVFSFFRFFFVCLCFVVFFFCRADERNE